MALLSLAHFILNDIIGTHGLYSFQELCNLFSIPGTSYFLYLRLRSALRAYGVPWNTQLKNHFLLDHLCNHESSRGLVSHLYDLFIRFKNSSLGAVELWNRDLCTFRISANWDVVWRNIFLSSKNLSHQLIHFKLAHRIYITPCRAFLMKLSNDKNCNRCQLGRSEERRVGKEC